MIEIWRDIEGYEGYYQVSNKSSVRSLDRVVLTARGHMKRIRGKILKPKIDMNGYIRYSLSKDSQAKEQMAHRLIAEAFIKNTDNKPFINHIDGIKTNNKISNLEWCTSSENQIHAHTNGLKVNKKGHEAHMSKLYRSDIELIIKMRESGKSYSNIAKKFDVCDQTICNIINAKTYKSTKVSDKALYVNCRNGSLNPRSVLVEDDIKEIVKMRENGMYYKDIAKKHGVDTTTIKSIFKGKTWDHLGINIDYKKISLNCPRGSSNITGTTVLLIARSHKEGLTAIELSRKFNINVSTIRDIIKGRTWSDLTSNIL